MPKQFDKEVPMNVIHVLTSNDWKLYRVEYKDTGRFSHYYIVHEDQEKKYGCMWRSDGGFTSSITPVSKERYCWECKAYIEDTDLAKLMMCVKAGF